MSCQALPPLLSNTTHCCLSASTYHKRSFHYSTVTPSLHTLHFTLKSPLPIHATLTLVATTLLLRRTPACVDGRFSRLATEIEAPKSHSNGVLGPEENENDSGDGPLPTVTHSHNKGTASLTAFTLHASGSSLLLPAGSCQ